QSVGDPEADAAVAAGDEGDVAAQVERWRRRPHGSRHRLSPTRSLVHRVTLAPRGADHRAIRPGPLESSPTAARTTPPPRPHAALEPRPWTRRSELMADVRAHITGSIWKVECAVGDSIAVGDEVMIIESMKMEMPVEAEDAGTVAEIRVAEGDSVEEGD